MDKMKKLTATFICTFAIVLTACGKTETNYNINDSGSWKDGTYTETVKQHSPSREDSPDPRSIMNGYKRNRK